MIKEQLDKHSTSIIFYAAACFLPNIFLFFLFNNNKLLNILHFGHFVVLAIIFAVIGVVLFLLCGNWRCTILVV